MPEKPHALSTIAPATPVDTDYDSICHAVMSTARGRWFLDEFARRNRNADTTQVLAAIERVATVVSAERAQHTSQEVRIELLEMARAIAQTRAEVAESRPESIAAAPGPSDPGDVRADVEGAAERLRDIAWSMRACGIELAASEQIEQIAESILAAASLHGAGDQRMQKLSEVLHYLEHRIDRMLDSQVEATADIGAGPIGSEEQPRVGAPADPQEAVPEIGPEPVPPPAAVQEPEHEAPAHAVGAAAPDAGLNDAVPEAIEAATAQPATLTPEPESTAAVETLEWRVELELEPLIVAPSAADGGAAGIADEQATRDVGRTQEPASADEHGSRVLAPATEPQSTGDQALDTAFALPESAPPPETDEQRHPDTAVTAFELEPLTAAPVVIEPRAPSSDLDVEALRPAISAPPEEIAARVVTEPSELPSDLDILALQPIRFVPPEIQASTLDHALDEELAGSASNMGEPPHPPADVVFLDVGEIALPRGEAFSDHLVQEMPHEMQESDAPQTADAPERNEAIGLETPGPEQAEPPPTPVAEVPDVGALSASPLLLQSVAHTPQPDDTADFDAADFVVVPAEPEPRTDSHADPPSSVAASAVSVSPADVVPAHPPEPAAATLLQAADTALAALEFKPPAVPAPDPPATLQPPSVVGEMVPVANQFENDLLALTELFAEASPSNSAAAAAPVASAEPSPESEILSGAWEMAVHAPPVVLDAPKPSTVPSMWAQPTAGTADDGDEPADFLLEPLLPPDRMTAPGPETSAETEIEDVLFAEAVEPLAPRSVQPDAQPPRRVTPSAVTAEPMASAAPQLAPPAPPPPAQSNVAEPRAIKIMPRHAVDDPLAALTAMTDEERIALFT